MKKIMANDTTANIILRLKDEFSKNLQSAGKNFESFARSVDQVGTAISRTGMKMVAIGTTMNAPFFAAAKAMEKYSFDAQQQMQRLNNEILALSKVISDAALPTIKAFNDNFSKTINVLKSIDPALLQNIANWAMTTGAILIAAGTIEIFTGKVISLIAKFARLAKDIALFSGGLIPGLIAVIGGLIFAWTKWHDQFVLVIDSLKFLWLQFCDTLMTAWQKFIEIISKIPGANKFAAQVDQLTIARQKLKQEMGAIAAGGHSNWAQGLQNFSNQVTGTGAKIKAVVDKAKKDIEAPMKDLQTRFKELSFSMSDSFADAFDQILFEGKGFADSMKNVFSSLGRSILKDFTSTVLRNAFNSLFSFGQMTPEQKGGTGIGGLAGAGFGSIFGPVGTALGGFLGGMFKFHEGGMIYAHAGLAPDEVPIIAQTGEGVLSRRGMAAIGGSSVLRAINKGNAPSGPGGQTVIYAPTMVIQAWDASDVYRNRKTLVAAIEQDIVSNGSLRRAIKGC